MVEQGDVVLKMFGKQSDEVMMKRRPSGRGDTWAAGGEQARMGTIAVPN